MSRATVILHTQEDRDRVCRWALKVAPGTRVEFKEVKRSLPQNARMWAMLTDVARQADLHGVKLSPDDWKLVFLDALKRELRTVPNLDGTGFVNLGRSSSDLSKQEMGDLMEIIAEWGSRNGVVFSDDQQEAA